jgi:hypothetical protein
MDEQGDFFKSPHARDSDVDTSKIAAEGIDITKQARKIIRSYADGSALLDEEAYRRQDMEGHQRCSDLRAEGLIVRVDKKLTDHASPGYRCVITDRGRDFLAGKPLRSILPPKRKKKP